MKLFIKFAAIMTLGGLLCTMFDAIHPFGYPTMTAMDDYFIIHALSARSSPNVVTALVFDYRAFDTLGEAAVLFTALLSIGALFRDGGKRE